MTVVGIGRAYQRGETIPVWVEVQDWLDVYKTPTHGVALLHLTDPKGVVKAGYISVLASVSFSELETVVGGTSGATGVIMSIPAGGLTLELQQITGVWQSGEAITSAGGASTTSSVIGSVPIDMDTDDTGYYYYNYTSALTDEPGWWRYRAKSHDGAAELSKYTVIDGGFALE